jgi:hypothetical protein
MSASPTGSRPSVNVLGDLQSGLDVAQIDLRLEKRDLFFESGLVDVDIPGLRSTVAAVTPTITAAFQGILEFERRPLRPDAQRFPSRRLKQDGESRRPRARQFKGEDLKERVAVVDRPMRLVEEAGAIQQVAELRTREAV